MTVVENIVADVVMLVMNIVSDDIERIYCV